jgi:small subunit ribosomal protein S4
MIKTPCTKKSITSKKKEDRIMARYTGPNNKKARRLSFSILENGKDIAKRPYGPGQHGKDRKRKPSNYSVQLAEKQKARFMYGISEKQFKKLVNDSAKMKGVHGENLLILLESRLDNIVYRIGFATTRRGARQLVNHGHITVNGKKVDIPSYRVKPGDVIAIKENSSDHKGIEIALANKVKRPEFINYDEKKRVATYVRYPERSELNADINESLIVEFYSRV